MADFFQSVSEFRLFVIDPLSHSNPARAARIVKKFQKLYGIYQGIQSNFDYDKQLRQRLSMTEISDRWSTNQHCLMLPRLKKMINF